MHRIALWATMGWVALVTVWAVALSFEYATRDPVGVPGMAVYALLAGFGLEFVSSEWRDGWRRRRGRRGHATRLSR